MLVQTQKCLVQGASAVGTSGAETISGSRFSEGNGRGSAGGERVRCGSRVRNIDKWLVGLQFHTEKCRTVWLYYVVDEAFDTAQAVRAAIQRAGSEPERVALGWPRTGVDQADRVEVQRIHRDAIGRLSLNDCL
ncbi:hypothetical protein [Streptomyces sp. NPDC096132]|uniref:hypothetical protein n=1 Tax=Streptomyces sp. NPDC096132 TaxID=3366075 RepID=UPI003830E5C9